MNWLGTVEVSSEQLHRVEEVEARLAAHAACDGWVQYANRWSWRDGGEGGASPPGPNGFPLCAELRVDGATSVHLRQRGDGWLWTTITERNLSQVAETPAPVIDDRDHGFDQDFASTEGRRRLKYRVWWRRGGALPVRPLAPYVARFIGWDKD